MNNAKDIKIFSLKKILKIRFNLNDIPSKGFLAKDDHLILRDEHNNIEVCKLQVTYDREFFNDWIKSNFEKIEYKTG